MNAFWNSNDKQNKVKGLFKSNISGLPSIFFNLFRKLVQFSETKKEKLGHFLIIT